MGCGLWSLFVFLPTVSTSLSVQATFDVKYYDTYAVVGYVLFGDHRSGTPWESGRVVHQGVEAYESGSFYKRELPCLLTAIHHLSHPFSLVYIDANVWLGDDEPGLGYHLYEALEKKVPVIGISKTRYLAETPLIREVYRGHSGIPLYVSSAGIALNEAATMVREMHGPNRIPTLIKEADMLSKKPLEE